MTIWETLIVSLFSASVGGCLTGYFTLRATKKAHENTLEMEREKGTSTIKGLLQAIHDEVRTLWDRYQDTMGPRVESLEPNQPLLGHWPVYQEYFSVYKGNTALLGHIDDPSLRKAIVTVYTLASALLDSFRFNNEAVARLENLSLLYQQTGNQVYERGAAEVRTQLTQYANVLKGLHGRVKEQTESLLAMLQKAA